MSGQREEVVGKKDESLPDEYEYTVEVAALETFKNILEGQGIATDVREKTAFKSTKLLDLKKLKEMGVVRSYHISVCKIRQTVEKG